LALVVFGAIECPPNITAFSSPPTKKGNSYEIYLPCIGGKNSDMEGPELDPYSLPSTAF